MSIQPTSNQLERYLSFLEQDHNNISLLEHISRYIDQNFENAQEVLAKLDDQYPHSKLLYARVLQRQDKLPKALTIVQNIVTHHPDNIAARGLLSLIYFDLQEEDLARTISAETLKRDPQNYDAQSVDIMLRVMIQNTTTDEIEHLLKNHPDDSRLWFALGMTYLNQGEIKNSEQALDNALKIHPEFYDCYISLGFCHILQDALEAAQNKFEQATVLDHNLAEGWGGLGLVFALKNDFSQANHYINKANHLNSSCFLANMAQTICFNQNDPENAKRYLIKTLQNHPAPIQKKLDLFLQMLMMD